MKETSVVPCTGPADGGHESEDDEMAEAEGAGAPGGGGGGGGKRGKRGKFSEEFKAKVLGVLQVSRAVAALCCALLCRALLCPAVLCSLGPSFGASSVL